MKIEELDAVRTVLSAFDDGVFVRDTTRDHEPGWVMKYVKPISALAVLARAVEELDAKPGDDVAEGR